MKGKQPSSSLYFLLITGSKCGGTRSCFIYMLHHNFPQPHECVLTAMQLQQRDDKAYGALEYGNDLYFTMSNRALSFSKF